jgi:hypothetical protein
LSKTPEEPSVNEPVRNKELPDGKNRKKNISDFSIKSIPGFVTYSEAKKQGALKELKKGKRKPQKVSVEIRTGRINK